MQLASRFANRSTVLRSNQPLSDDQIRSVAPSIFADAPHESRSERYSYIPTAAVLTELRKSSLKGSGADDEMKELARETTDQFTRQSDPYYATARLWDDGIIHPL